MLGCCAGVQSAGGATAGEQAAAVPTGVVDAAFYSAMGMQQLRSEGTHPREQAEQLLHHMASFTQDISMVRVGPLNAAVGDSGAGL
jgi:hypothetical protein